MDLPPPRVCRGDGNLFIMPLVQPRSDARTQVHQTRPFQRPDRSLKADWLDERSTSDRAVRQRVDPARPGGLRFSAPTDRPLHHPRPGIYNAVLRPDRFGTGHRLGIQFAPGGPSHHRSPTIPEETKMRLRRLDRAWVQVLVVNGRTTLRTRTSSSGLSHD